MNLITSNPKTLCLQEVINITIFQSAYNKAGFLLVGSQGGILMKYPKAQIEKMKRMYLEHDLEWDREDKKKGNAI